MKTLSLKRRYNQEKQFRKNDPIFVDSKEKNDFIRNEIIIEQDEEKKALLKKSMFI